LASSSPLPQGAVAAAFSLVLSFGASLFFVCGYQDDRHVYLADALDFFSAAL
jgi:hypothetical protein